MSEMQYMRDARCFLFDMDGTIYLGEQLLPGAKEFLAYLEEQAIPFFFITNNSSKSREDYVRKLAHFGLDYPESRIFTSGEATAITIRKQQWGQRLYVVGTPSLEAEMRNAGFELTDEDPDCVVLGFDTTLTYAKLWKLCDLVRDGKPYIATHPDFNCPTETGFMPDIGAMMALVEASTGRKADLVVGKPNAPIVAAIVEKTGFLPGELVMVGDRLYTDIAIGRAGLQTVLVLSGETKAEDLPGSPFQPNVVADHLAHLLELFKAERESR